MPKLVIAEPKKNGVTSPERNSSIFHSSPRRRKQLVVLISWRTRGLRCGPERRVVQVVGSTGTILGARDHALEHSTCRVTAGRAHAA
jgi:hypothetical protein